MKSEKTMYNVIFGLGSQIIIILLGLIVPRVILTHYGSDTNGLTSTVTQIFTYMALLEAGIGQATRNALYFPVKEKSKDGISYIMSVSRRYYRKITVFYALGILVLATLLPMIIKSNINYFTIFFVVFFEGLSGVISFWYIQNWTQLLIAEGKNYVKANLDMLDRVLCYCVKIVMAYMGVNIAVIQIAYFFVSLGKLAFYKYYFHKHYSWINYDAAPKEAILQDRNAYIITEVAWTLFSSTDMIVLSIFCSTEIASVYAIYNMIFANINTLLNSVYQGTQFILGQAYYEGKEKYMKVHDAFNSLFVGAMTILMSVTYIMILPFIRMYTAGVTDIEYIQPILPLFFCLVQILSWSRFVGGNLTGIAGYAKNVCKISMIEAITNIVGSIVLVNFFGIVGVIAATAIALPLKVIYVTWLTETKILRRSCFKTISILGINYFAFFIVYFVEKVIDLNIHNVLEFIKYGIAITIISTVIIGMMNILVNRQCVKIIMNAVKKK